jgi:hypothetical protein
MAAAVSIRVGFGWYVKSEAFQRRTAAAVGHALRADGTFTPFQLADATFYSDRFVARGSRGAFFSDLQADQIRAAFNWRALFHRTCQIDELNVQRLAVRFANQHGPEIRPTKRESEARQPVPRWKLDLRKANIAQSTWDWVTNDGNPGSITGSSFTLTPNGDSWLIDGNGGKMSQSGWPALSIESARLRYTSSSLFVTDSVLRTGTGRITLSGEVEFRKAADLQTQFTDISLTPLLPADWRLRLSGKMSGTASIHAPLADGSIYVEGRMQLTDGQVEALPLLDQIAAFTRTERFRRVSLTKASLSFARDSSLITAKDIMIESEGLMRIEGACTVVNDQIDGVFQIGVTSASLQWLPGSQARVFTIAHDGYYWTSLRLAGPVAHPTEDLTPRLVAAAAGEILQNAQDTVLDAAKSILELVPH